MDSRKQRLQIGTRESEKAIAILRQAVQRYPDYGPAHSLLAFALLVSGHVGWIPESNDYRSERAKAKRRSQSCARPCRDTRTMDRRIVCSRSRCWCPVMSDGFQKATITVTPPNSPTGRLSSTTMTDR